MIAVLLLAAAPTASPARPGPTLAVEDTLRMELPEMLVSAPRVTLDEILDRVARGEARRDSALQDQSFTATMRVVKNTIGKKAPELFQEDVYKVYRKRPGKMRQIALRHWELKPKKAKASVSESDDSDATFSSNMSEEIVNFAFRADARREFRYRIVGRDIVGDHLVYRIEFKPRSALINFAPSGVVWVDTNEFVILRQEVRFDRSPIPLILKGIPRMVVERQRIGDHWVLRRMLMRAETTIPIPGFGRAFDFSMTYDDFTVNTGLPDSLFATVPAKGGARGAAK